jgi:tetratricopeptide (TPR) repeat protein
LSGVILRVLWRAAAIAAGCIAAFFFMGLIFDIRVRELRASLKNLNNNQTTFRTLALISRYQLIRDRIGHIDEANQFKSEGKTMLALGQGTQDEGERLTALDRAAINLINGLNWLTGAEPMKNYQASKDQRALELAYLYELRRDYVNAVATYDLAIRITPASNQDALQYAYLHRGFCLSLMDKKNEALADYSIVISSNQAGEFRYTAEILSALIRDLLARAGRVDAMVDSEGKAEAYYKLAAYPKALAVYERLQKKGRLSARALYYSGRVHEELGQSEKAAEKFRVLITKKADNAWALRANRRMYALGAFYGGDKKYREESQKNAQTVVKDRELIRQAEKFEAVVKQNEESAKAKETEVAATVALVKKEQETLAGVNPPEVPPVKTEPQPAPLAEKKPPPARKVVVPAAPPATPLTVAAPAPVKPPVPAAPTPQEKLQSALKRGNLTRVERKEILTSFKEIELITLTDDNEIWGIPISESKEKIAFFTVMGKVSIARERIKSREKIDSDEAFR